MATTRSSAGLPAPGPASGRQPALPRSRESSGACRGGGGGDGRGSASGRHGLGAQGCPRSRGGGGAGGSSSAAAARGRGLRLRAAGQRLRLRRVAGSAGLLRALAGAAPPDAGLLPRAALRAPPARPAALQPGPRAARRPADAAPAPGRRPAAPRQPARQQQQQQQQPTRPPTGGSAPAPARSSRGARQVIASGGGGAGLRASAPRGSGSPRAGGGAAPPSAGSAWEAPLGSRSGQEPRQPLRDPHVERRLGGGCLGRGQPAEPRPFPSCGEGAPPPAGALERSWREPPPSFPCQRRGHRAR